MGLSRDSMSWQPRKGQGVGVLAAEAKHFRWAFYFNIETLQRKGSVSPPFNVAQSFLSTSCFSEHSMWLVENLIKQKPFTILWMDFGEICSQCMFLNSSIAALILHILERACEKLAFNFEFNKWQNILTLANEGKCFIWHQWLALGTRLSVVVGTEWTVTIQQQCYQKSTTFLLGPSGKWDHELPSLCVENTHSASYCLLTPFFDYWWFYVLSWIWRMASHFLRATQCFTSISAGLNAVDPLKILGMEPWSSVCKR